MFINIEIFDSMRSKIAKVRKCWRPEILKVRKCLRQQFVAVVKVQKNVIIMIFYENQKQNKL